MFLLADGRAVSIIGGMPTAVHSRLREPASSFTALTDIGLVLDQGGEGEQHHSEDYDGPHDEDDVRGKQKRNTGREYDCMKGIAVFCCVAKVE